MAQAWTHGVDDDDCPGTPGLFPFPRSLTSSTTRTVSNRTRERVLTAAREPGSEDPRIADASQRTLTVGSIVHSVASPIFGELFDGLIAEAALQNAEVLLTTTADDPDREHATVRSSFTRKVDAIALIPSAGYRERTQAILRHCGIPNALVDRGDDNALDQVICDNQSASVALVGHLLSLGHRRIGLLRGMDGLTTTAERESGYGHAFARHPLAVDDRHIINNLSNGSGDTRDQAADGHARASHLPSTQRTTA